MIVSPRKAWRSTGAVELPMPLAADFLTSAFLRDATIAVVPRRTLSSLDHNIAMPIFLSLPCDSCPAVVDRTTRPGGTTPPDRISMDPPPSCGALDLANATRMHQIALLSAV